MKSLSQAYLLLYNSLNVVAWTHIAVLFWRNIATFGLHEYDHLYNELEPIVRWTQSLAVLEILSAAAGLVRSNFFITAIQVASRLHIVWIVWYRFPESTHSIWYLVTILAWSHTEVVRYLFYVTESLNISPYVIKWLRFSVFLVAYPCGIIGEALCVVAALPLMAGSSASSYWPYPMPNRFNFHVHLYPFYIGLLAVSPAFAVVLYKHMLNRRTITLTSDVVKNK